jgi:hypothetical protein
MPNNIHATPFSPPFALRAELAAQGLDGFVIPI